MNKSYSLKTSKYKKKLFLYYFCIVLTFSVIIAIFQYNKEHEFKKEKLENSLNIYSELINLLIKDTEITSSSITHLIDSVRLIIPEKNIRISVITPKGDVIYDNNIKKISQLDNHLSRPEIQKSLISHKGSNIRISNSTGKVYYYYSRYYYKYFIRTALPYNEDTANLLKANNLFLYFLIGLFGVSVLFLIYVTDHFGNSVSQLRNFAIRAGRNEKINPDEDFGKTELGEISNQIVKIYNKLKITTDALSSEKEKLIKHLQISQEGIAIFNKNKELILWNNHFIDYINYITPINNNNYSEIFKNDKLNKITKFLEDNLDKLNNNYIPNVDIISTKQTVKCGHKIFLYQLVVFLDGEFEISVTDITKLENENTIKQEMSLNIAHELKTPITAISGFLETIKDDPDLPEKTRELFIERSCIQINRLAHLIQDISVLTKIEEANKLFTIKQIDLGVLIEEIVSDFEFKCKQTNVKIIHNFERYTYLNANSELLDSIFRNLIDNAIKYAGENITIKINKYFEDANYHYFSCSDDGKGIPDKHLSRIFERFYRADNDRSRKLGGTGLGLSIVKNAVLFHKGRIYIKNRDEGGLEFFFSIKKNIS